MAVRATDGPSCEFCDNFISIYMLDSVVEDERSVRKSTSIDVYCRGIDVGEKQTATVISDKDPLAMTDNSANYEERSSAGDGPKEKADVDTTPGEEESKPSNAESISQSNGKKKKKKKKKKKASKGTESTQNNTEEKETNNEGQTSQGGI